MKYIHKTERVGIRFRYNVYDDMKQTQMTFVLSEHDAYWMSEDNGMIRIDDAFVYSRGFDNFDVVNPDAWLIPLPF